MHRISACSAPTVLDRLALIALGRAAGFSLDEMARIFAPDGRPRMSSAPPPWPIRSPNLASDV